MAVARATKPGADPSGGTGSGNLSAGGTCSRVAARSRSVVARRIAESASTLTWVVDTAVICLATVAGMLGRRHLPAFNEANDLTAIVGPFRYVIVAVWLLSLLVHGAYRARDRGVGMTEFRRVATGSVVASGAVGIVCFLVHVPLSRGFFVLTFGLGIPALLVGRLLMRRALQRARARGHFTQRTLIVGPSAHVAEVAAVLRRESWLGYQVVGALLPTGVSQPMVFQTPVVGHTDDVLELVDRYAADIVIFTAGATATSLDLRRIAWDLEDHHAQMVVVPSLSDVSSGRLHMRPVGGLPLVHVERPQSIEAGRWLKRAFDLVGTLAILLVSAPVLLAGAVCVRLEDSGPVLFRQQRVGRGGRVFDVFKLRSMVVDAQAQQASFADHRPSAGLRFKMADDPRVTRIGRVIRRWSIDELPQLWNVLRGEMSLVGPRPALPEEVAGYDEDIRRRLAVRPGLTGLWQVSGRSNLSWEDAVRLDLYYVDNWSILRDVSILLRTIRVVLTGEGAY